jgi:hypothetical protein
LKATTVLPSKKERKSMHLVMLGMLDTASSGAAFIVILAVVAALRGK